ncbi:MAG: hypothetical protein R6U50_02585 [Desulfobacterales bacterium]
MKFTTYGLSIFMLFCMGWAGAYAEKLMPASQSYFYIEVECLPSDAGEYEKAQKNTLELYRKHDFPFSFSYYTSDDLLKLMVFEIDAYSDIDQIVTALSDIKGKLGEDKNPPCCFPFNERYADARCRCFTVRRDLSYAPANPLFRNEHPDPIAKVKGYFWRGYYIEPENKEKAEAVAKKWRKIYESRHTENGYEVFTAQWRRETPTFTSLLVSENLSDYVSHLRKDQEAGSVFVVLQNGRNADHAILRKKTENMLGEEGSNLFNETKQIASKFEQKWIVAHSGLSYRPIQHQCRP